jgi:hypothetical protein
MTYIKYVPVLSFIAFSVKSFVQVPSQFDIGAILITACLTGFFYYKESSKELTSLNSRLDHAEKILKENQSEISTLRTSLGSQRLGQTLRPTSAQNR